MKITCALSDFDFGNIDSDLNIVLYGHADNPAYGSVGAALKTKIVRASFHRPKSMGFVVSGLAIVSPVWQDIDPSPDGWTREFDLTISVVDARSECQFGISEKLRHFTTDRWTLRFMEGGILPRLNTTRRP
jgi:hypothetical protein